MRFDWGQVQPRVVHALLEVAYAQEPSQLTRLTSDEQKRRYASRVYGDPPTFKNLESCPGAWEVLRDDWLLVSIR